MPCVPKGHSSRLLRRRQGISLWIIALIEPLRRLPAERAGLRPALRTAGLRRRASSRSGRSSRPPRRRSASPGWSPSRACSRPCSAASSARRAKCGRDASGSVVNGGIVERPPTRTGQRSMKAARDSTATPPLPCSAGDVDLDQDLGLGTGVAPELRECAVRADRVQEADLRDQPLDLATLQVADEVPGESRAPALPLHLEVLQADSRRPA